MLCVRDSQRLRDKKRQRENNFHLNTFIFFVSLKSETSYFVTLGSPGFWMLLLFSPSFTHGWTKQYLALEIWNCSYFWVCYHSAEILSLVSPVFPMLNLRLGANPHAIASTLIWEYIMLVMAKLCKTIHLLKYPFHVAASSNMGHQVLFWLADKYCRGHYIKNYYFAEILNK